MNAKRKSLHCRIREAAMQAQIRRSIAMHMLNGMLASAPVVDRLKVDARKWAKKAYEFADAIIAEGKKR